MPCKIISLWRSLVFPNHQNRWNVNPRNKPPFSMSSITKWTRQTSILQVSSFVNINRRVRWYLGLRNIRPIPFRLQCGDLIVVTHQNWWRIPPPPKSVSLLRIGALHTEHYRFRHRTNPIKSLSLGRTFHTVTLVPLLQVQVSVVESWA